MSEWWERMSEPADGKASGPILTSGFSVVLDHSEMGDTNQRPPGHSPWRRSRKEDGVNSNHHNNSNNNNAGDAAAYIKD